MPPLTPQAPGVYDSATDPDSSAAVTWAASIESEPEPALLSRILQKAGPPEAEILQVRYNSGLGPRDSGRPDALIEVLFNAQPARARSIAGKWEKIVTVHHVSLFRMPSAAPKPNSRLIPPTWAETTGPITAMD